MRAPRRFRFADLPILYKMLSGFALCSLLTAALGGFAVDRLGAGRALMLDFSNSSLPAIQQLMSMQAALAGVRTAETQLVHAPDPLQRLGYQQRVYDMRNQYLGADAVFRTLVGSGEERSRYDAVAKSAQAYFAGGDRLIAATGGDGAELATLQDQAASAAAALDGELKAMVDARTIGLQQIIIDAALGFRGYVRWIVLGTLATALLSFALGWLLSRAVARPLGRAAAFAGAIADGALETRIEVDARDETGRVLEAMQRMAGVLGAFSAAQLEMAGQHKAGIVDYRIDTAPFPGGFGRIVGDLNALVDGHIAVNRSVTELVSRYAVGDLSRDMPALPGQLAEVTATIATVKRNMVGVNSEIRRLVDAAAAGDFTARGDAGRFQFEFQAMVQGLNRLMESNDVATADLGQALAALADGDLGLRMQGDYRGRLAEMQASFNATADALAGLIGGIALAGHAIDTAAREISLGNDDLARRTEQQAANLEETAASMEELTGTVRHNADNAREANQLALGASTTATRGAEVVNAVVGTMQEIEGSSRRIADIIGVIDGIAFQTNILALNAAVEAARAGEQGRGFAVVASEVRTLAQRSAQAAQEIKTLIGESVERTGQGAEQATLAGAAITEVVESVQRVTAIIGEITAASQEQAGGIEQVNQAVVQMDETTQQNAALVEEASAAARSLEEQAGALMVSVGRFRLAAAAPAARDRAVPSTLSPAQV